MAHRYMLASFPNVDEAADAYNQLTLSQYQVDEVSVITHENVREDFDTVVDDDTKDDITVGEGMATGAAVGGLVGLLVSAVPIAIAGLPSLIVVGPIAAALGLSGVAGTTVTGAVSGAAVGGLVGALDHLGIGESEAKEYERTVKEGGVLLAVPITENNEDEVRVMLEENNAENITIGTEG